MDDLKAVVLKLAAADNLRSQGYLRSEQSLPKNNKRGEQLKYLSRSFHVVQKNQCFNECFNVLIVDKHIQLCNAYFKNVKDNTKALYCITTFFFVLPFTACFWKYCVTN